MGCGQTKCTKCGKAGKACTLGIINGICRICHEALNKIK